MKLISSEYNPVSGITEEYWMHPGGGKVTVRRLQDVEPMLKQNAEELNAKSSKSRVGIAAGLGVKVASIPMGLVENLKQEKGLDVMSCKESDLKRLLNDSDYAKLRTAHGRL